MFSQRGHQFTRGSFFLGNFIELMGAADDLRRYLSLVRSIAVDAVVARGFPADPTLSL
jgi:hypothetical protein